ncbi:hypothetical protein E4L96_16500 [Massilia arenosa]|uniref:Uncharacterized protein n=1 Tax=Zemynaea arenosa TaxID=2561931 RepID=A0A4Y9S9E9_9BURK|nr:hypothetical protein [Massilia arenosa]TFW16369.1 hypothetical protein E4L96_16500 [Massilia arenosa]
MTNGKSHKVGSVLNFPARAQSELAERIAQAMGELNREEVEARIETAAMRMTSSIVRIEERVAAFAALMEERIKKRLPEAPVKR